jgi:hypothetical protein
MSIALAKGPSPSLLGATPTASPVKAAAVDGAAAALSPHSAHDANVHLGLTSHFSHTSANHCFAKPHLQKRASDVNPKLPNRFFGPDRKEDSFEVRFRCIRHPIHKFVCACRQPADMRNDRLRAHPGKRSEEDSKQVQRAPGAFDMVALFQAACKKNGLDLSEAPAVAMIQVLTG